MKLKKNRVSISFWFCFFLVCVILYFLLFTTKGAIRRNLLNGYPWQAVSTKIVEVPRSDHSSLYTTNPIIKEKESGKQLYFNCYQEKGIKKCSRITNMTPQ